MRYERKNEALFTFMDAFDSKCVAAGIAGDDETFLLLFQQRIGQRFTRAFSSLPADLRPKTRRDVIERVRHQAQVENIDLLAVGGGSDVSEQEKRVRRDRGNPNRPGAHNRSNDPRRSQPTSIAPSTVTQGVTRNEVPAARSDATRVLVHGTHGPTVRTLQISSDSN
jgi:hypothetical protein